jgi:hypothetical protein
MKISDLKTLVDAAIANHPRHCTDSPWVIAKARPGATIPDFWRGVPIWAMSGKNETKLWMDARQLKTALRYCSIASIWWLED